MKTKTAVLNEKPDAGNPRVRFDEGEVASYPPTVGRPEGVAMRGAKPRRGSPLYTKVMVLSLGGILLFAGPGAFAETPSVDFAGKGVTIKRLNGMCNTIPMKGNLFVEGTNRLSRLIRALEIPETRFHDVVLDNAGIQLVDVSRIFPLFHADENDPRNYNFRPTDLYLARARELGGELEFRFGEQIEHQGEKFQVQPPPDIEKWGRVCVNIARHYNDGWADGYRWNIRRFSVWEEPDNNELLADATKGNYEGCYFKMYAAVARGIKRLWPEAHVGGPNSMGYGGAFEKFVRHCAAEKLPLDFAAYTSYYRWTEDFFGLVRKARRTLDDCGFGKTELQVSEWHRGPEDWGMFRTDYKRCVADLNGVPSVAFQCAVLTQGQTEPIDHLFYYAMHIGSWGIFDAQNCPRAAYYGFRDFAEAVHGAVRVPGPVRPAPGWYALATRRDDGSVRLLLTAYHAKDALRLKVKGAALKSATSVVETGEPTSFTGFAFADGELRVPKPAGDAVYLFRD